VLPDGSIIPSHLAHSLQEPAVIIEADGTEIFLTDGVVEDVNLNPIDHDTGLPLTAIDINTGLPIPIP